MDKMSFGEILRETRERKGLDLNATARRLRIRPDILHAIEEGNFSAMPPRGYARNMVNGYARYLGLNPTEITGMYLDELYAYQVDYESRRMRPTGIEMPSSQSSVRSGRSMNRRTYYERDEREALSQATTAQEDKRGRSRSSRGERLYPEGRTHQARGSALPSDNYTNFYSGPGPIGFLRTNWRYLVAALVGLIVVALLVSQIFSCTRRPEPEPETVPVSGVESSDIAAIQQPKAPTSFTMEYTVEDGASSWIEVYVDEQIQVGEAVTGPQNRSFTSSDSIQFITANPAPVKVKIDGKEVELEMDDTGVVNMTWNFSDILAQWLADHPGAKAASTLSSSSGADASGTAAAGDGTGAANAGSTAADVSGTDSASLGAAATDSAQAGDSAQATGTVAGTSALDNASVVNDAGATGASVVDSTGTGATDIDGSAAQGTSAVR
ncbi:MAG: helix-turn-helix domain-containing protein [Eggerthellaceae bacterium]|nr:helix-turn-helix domain-containing protein [Eggerthellaceae bacterium]